VRGTQCQSWVQHKTDTMLLLVLNRVLVCVQSTLCILADGSNWHN
jgi:hypothetical protein